MPTLKVKDGDGADQLLDVVDIGGGIYRPTNAIASVPADPFGASADAAILSDSSGSISSKLRGLVKWAAERMPASLGQKAAAACLPVVLPSDAPLPTKISTANSTTTVLGSGAAFTGTGEDVSAFRAVVISVYASHASASGGLSLEFSSDGTNWDIAKTYTIAATTGAYYVLPTLAKYFRAVYTNGGTLQTAFRLQTILHPTVPGVPTILPADQEALAVSGSLSVGSSLPAGTNLIGYVGHGKTIKTVTGTISATTTIVSAVASKRIKVFAYSLITSSTSAVTATFKSGAGGTALWTVPMQAISGGVSGANLASAVPSFLFGTAAGSLLELALSASQSVTYSISYFDDDNS